MKDPYEILNLARNATVEELRLAYRNCAKIYHPDSGAATADEAKFAEAQQAYHFLLKELESPGARITSYQRRWREYAKYQAKSEEQPKGKAEPRDFNPERDETLKDILDQLQRQKDFRSSQERMRKNTASSARRSSRSGAEITHWLTVSFSDAILGTKREIDLDEKRRISVNIPAGIGDGQKLRINSQAPTNEETYIGVVVAHHEFFRRDGRDIHFELPVRLDEALLGTRIRIPTLHGAKEIDIPAGVNCGHLIRLEGEGTPAHRGAPAGDMLITVQICWPETIDPELLGFLREWGKSKEDYNPRAGIDALLLS